MKKIIFFLALSSLSLAYTQSFSIGTKAGISFSDKPDTSLFSTHQTIIAMYNSAKDQTNSYHIGFFTRIAFSSFFIQPELYFTTFETDYVTNAASQQEYEVKQKRIELPVLAGIRVLKIARLQAGPHFTYNFEDDINLEEIQNIEQDKVSVGLQLGGGIDIGKIGIDVRYERRLTDNETEFLHNNTNFVLSQNPNQIVASISYRF